MVCWYAQQFLQFVLTHTNAPAAHECTQEHCRVVKKATPRSKPLPGMQHVSCTAGQDCRGRRGPVLPHKHEKRAKRWACRLTMEGLLEQLRQPCLMTHMYIRKTCTLPLPINSEAAGHLEPPEPHTAKNHTMLQETHHRMQTAAHHHLVAEPAIISCMPPSTVCHAAQQKNNLRTHTVRLLLEYCSPEPGEAALCC